MNILYFASVAFYQKPNPSFHLMTLMIDKLLESGHSVYFVGVRNKKLNRDIPETLIRNHNFHYNLTECVGVKKSKFVLRYLNGIIYALLSYNKVKKYAKKCDVLFLQSSPTILYNVIVAKMVAGRKRIIVNIQDMFPGSSIVSGVMPKIWMQKFFCSLQKIVYRKADVIVGISEDMKLRLLEQGVPADKVRVILNWFDDRFVHEVKWEDNRFVKKYNMSHDKFYLQYAGTIGYVFDYKMVLEVAKCLKGYDDIEIQIIGEGSCKGEFMEAVQSENLNNIKFLPLEPQYMVSDVYSSCTACLIPLKHGVIGNSVPSKAGLLMACKRPIITSVDAKSKYAEEINNHGFGIACGDDDPMAIVNAVLMLRNDRDLGREMGMRGYAYGHELYSSSENMRKYLKLFEEVVKNA